MTQVTFFIMPESPQVDSTSEADLHQFACELTANLYRDKQKVFIYTKDKKTAEAIDETLWQFSPEHFVAHNLQGEGPSFGSPVEIGDQAPTNRYPILINFSQQVPQFGRKFQHIYDFVPADEVQKQAARERYKAFRQAGYVIQTSPAEIANFK
ncbi:DNA polymerase III subunit chi [Catenovulum maritimum]|uniref:DNA polymerase III subunit chi n=1 Tax=Catenovulum maritimum TaxID=1513271 RepID=A0A0J8H097_9ALTE|nr:DNA polymerase III subunit chi [Catenovulum maritimum]KMT66438.1 hypothetical protein XM47_04045 [Catenovulum maritimum]